MASDFRVSILVPICNVQRYLRQCLESLISQTLQDIQIICIDDGSTDLSPEIIEEFRRIDDRIEVISKPNSGYGDSMNKGLDLAKGEYIGIVESDDFASHDMFERLYRLAKEHDLDVVKSNFLAHEEGSIPEKDPLVDNLGNGPFDTVFRPIEHQGIFLWRPAIWSGLYKSSFLRENDIRFLPTPGASFQDTSFNFKVFAAAERVFLTKDAFLHYRTDNASSSVKSQKKVFCICDEYQEIWRFAKERHLLETSLKTLIPFMQYGGYKWNLDRLTPSLQSQFYPVFVDEFKQLRERDLLKQDQFNEPSWNGLVEMLSDPERFYEKEYGPKNIDTSYILLLAGKQSKSAEQAVLSLAKRIGRNDEIYCMAPNEGYSFAETIAHIRKSDKRIFNADEILLSNSSYLIDLDKIRGSQLRVIAADSMASKEMVCGDEHEAMTHPAESPYREGGVITYPIQYLKSIEAPIFLSLLINGFYLSKESCTDGSCDHPDSWAPSPLEECDPDDYLASESALTSLFQWTNRTYSNSSFEEHVAALKKIDPLWRSHRECYRKLRYSDKSLIKDAPSAELLNPAVLDASGNPTNSDINVSVIIPIYNAEQYLRECLDSVFSQTLSDIEAICVIDGSCDQSFAILDEYAKRGHRMTIAFQVNMGAGGARNRGITFSRGRYLSFIDPDDYYPSNEVLSRLHDAASENNALICGGSFSTICPNEEAKTTFTGPQSFYTFTSEGFRTIEQDQNDYGWIRFVYEKRFLDENDIRFLDMQWYEDPVFFIEAVSKAGGYYAIPTVVYCYREDYKQTEWTVGKTRDLLRGISKNLDFASQQKYVRLYTTLIRRLNEDYYDAIVENLSDYEVFQLLVEIQSKIDPSLISFVREAGQNCYFLRVFDEIKNQPINNTAIMRAADVFSKSKVYKSLQSVRSAIRH